ncbi:response regulator [uncultured Roseovarius sp.]|uniref:response regulator n=1 Tax=uncultured Roseovarius sp. TaxID=293344 RepID=UPI0025E8BA3B|nr:response regulator [uncultured Roseovarius sp.]
MSESGAVEPDPDAACVLVVDDNALNRSKMRMAVRALGHNVNTASGGSEALQALRDGPYDAVLLDIVMPEVDGYEVLAGMQGDDALRDIPVIVISALEDETESVVRAIELGAEDFLPKSFDPVILRARLNASLSKKRFRDEERAMLAGLATLTEAAETVESGHFRPEKLDLGILPERQDGLGRLAVVFRGMADEIFTRELQLLRAANLLKGGLLVIAFGVVWGIMPALSRMSSGLGTEPFGLALITNGIGAVFCLTIAAYKRKLPRLGWVEWQFYILLALLVGVGQKLVTFWVAGHLDAAILSMIVTLQGIMVFGIAAAMGLEKATPKRLIGLLIGMAGVGAVLLSRLQFNGSDGAFWILAALLLPALMAIETVFLGARMPAHIDVFASIGVLMVVSFVMLIPMVALSGQSILPSDTDWRLTLIVLLLGFAGAGSMILTLQIVEIAGPVFAGQGAYAMTLAGIVWGMLLLDESLSPLAWGAFLVIVLGLYLVEPKARDGEFVLKRSFSGRHGKAGD